MKHKSWLNHILHSALAWLLAVSAIGSIATGFDLPMGSMAVAFFWCAVFAVAFAVLFSLPHGWKIVVGFGILTLVFCWNSETFMAELVTLIYRISYQYHRICGWVILGESLADSVGLPLLLWAALTAACVNRYYFYREGLYAVLITAILPLGLCMITLETVPDAMYLFLMLFSFGIMLITDWTGRNLDSQRNRLILYLTAPVVLFLILLFSLNPQDEYVNHAEELVEKVESVVDQIEEITDSVSQTTTSDAYSGQNLNLQNIGPKSNLSFTVMTVNSSTGGNIYLRGRDFDVYTGTDWRSSVDRRETFSTGNITSAKLTITTTKVRDILYIPYYSTKSVGLKDGACWNDDKILEYSYFLSDRPSVRTDAPDERYTILPQDTRRWAVPLVDRIINNASTNEAKILAIRNYVRDSAVYNRRTSRMDPSYDDFAQWFLEESDRGYCVHFATAATVLLRAAGIPARYVEGYLVKSVPSKDVTVTNRDAHAWVEYYDGESGAWRILEVTPPDLGSSGTETTEKPTEPSTRPTENETEPDTTVTVPSVTEPSDTEPETPTERPTEPGTTEEVSEWPEWAGTAIWVLLAGICLPLQADLRVLWKRNLWENGIPNEKAIARWRQSLRLAKVLKKPFPAELDTLAQKAKFSQHTLREEELMKFEEFRRSMRNLIHGKPWYLRLFYRWILAIE